MIIKLAAIILFFNCCFIHSQDSLNISKSIPEKLQNDLEILGKDAAGFFTAPLYFSGNDWIYAAGVIAGTVLLFNLDNPAKNNIGRKTILSLNKDFWDLPTSYGVVGYANLFSIATYATGLITDNDDIRVTGRMLFESLTFSGISVMVLRYVFGRIRPYYDEGPWKFYWFETSNEIQSFPSGHTVVAFAMSTILAERIGNIFARIGLYGLAALTGFSRVYNNQHWFSDVAAGALLGIGSGLFVLNMDEKRMEPENKISRLIVFPSFNGINFRLEF